MTNALECVAMGGWSTAACTEISGMKGSALWSLQEMLTDQWSFVLFFPRQNQPTQGGDDVPWFPIWPPAKQLPDTPGSPKLPEAILPRTQHPTPHQGESMFLTPLLNLWSHWIEFKTIISFNLCTSLTHQWKKWHQLPWQQGVRRQGWRGKWRRQIPLGVKGRRPLTLYLSAQGEKLWMKSIYLIHSHNKRDFLLPPGKTKSFTLGRYVFVFKALLRPSYTRHTWDKKL